MRPIFIDLLCQKINKEEGSRESRPQRHGGNWESPSKSEPKIERESAWGAEKESTEANAAVRNPPVGVTALGSTEGAGRPM